MTKWYDSSQELTVIQYANDYDKTYKVVIQKLLCYVRSNTL